MSCSPTEIVIDGERYYLVHESESGLAEPKEGYPEGYVSPNFREAEFTCNHCGKLHENGIPQELIDVLERARKDLGSNPITITSGYRCPTHNANVGGASQSKHLDGIATDIQVRDVAPSVVQDYFKATYPGKYGIGVYNSFTHIDIRPEKARW